MPRFNIPTRNEVNASNQGIFDKLESSLGFVPNLYAYYAKNDTALGDYLQFQNRQSTLSKKEIEVVNLIVSEINGCRYCQSAHTVVAGMNGFSAEQIIQIRQGAVPFDAKLNALAELTVQVTENKGKASEATKEKFFNAGYTEQNLIDVVLKIGDKVISNYIHNIAEFDIDFPVAAELASVSA